MTYNENVLLNEIFDKLYTKLINEDFVIAESGVKTDPSNYILEFNGRKTPEKYCKSELEWYDSQSLYVKDIPGKVPKIWENISDKNGKINSNYGWCIYSEENYNQFDNALNELISDKSTRRATMI